MSRFLLLGCAGIVGLAIFLTARFNLFSERNTSTEVALEVLISEQKIDKEHLEIWIDKSDYRLEMRVGEKVVKSYPIVLGGNPKDDKRREGDQCTPEGTFKIRSKYPHKSWSKFIWIDYPNEDSWRKHNAAKAAGEIPEGASIGGEIGIHGVPDGKDYLINRKVNWTLGCIALKNDDVNEIYPYIDDETLVHISK